MEETCLGFVADIHAANHRQFSGELVGGLNQRARQIVAALGDGMAALQQEAPHRVIVLGDLFDTVRPTPPLVRAVADALVKGMPEDRSNVTVLLGNHDRASTAEHDHAAAPIGLSDRIDVVDSPRVDYTVGAYLLHVPYMAGPAAGWLPDAVADLARECRGLARRVLCTHIGIWDDDTPVYLRGAKDALSIGAVLDLCKANKIDAVFAGNWHKRKVWRGPPLVVIPGTTVPPNFGDDDASVGNSLLVRLNDRGVSHHWRPVPGPRWLRVESAARLAEVTPPAVGHLYVRALIDQGVVAEANRSRDRLQASGVVTVELQVESTTARLAAKDAAKLARSAVSVDQAVVAYVAKTPVDPPGTVDGVVSRVADYRKRTC